MRNLRSKNFCVSLLAAELTSRRFCFSTRERDRGREREGKGKSDERSTATLNISQTVKKCSVTKVGEYENRGKSQQCDSSKTIYRFPLHVNATTSYCNALKMHDHLSSFHPNIKPAMKTAELHKSGGKEFILNYEQITKSVRKYSGNIKR